MWQHHFHSEKQGDFIFLIFLRVPQTPPIIIRPIPRKQRFWTTKPGMITIPINTNTGIRIPAWTPPEKPKSKQGETVPPIGVSIPQAAKLLNIGKPLMANLVKTGKIRAVKTGKRVVVSVQSLHEFVNGEKLCNSPENNPELQGKKE